MDGRASRRRRAGGMTTKADSRLAIDGGEPVRRTLLPYAHQVIDDRDVRAVVEALRSDWLTTGPRVRQLEERLEAVTGVRHAVSFSSGTAALHGAVAAAGLGAGDEAITTPLTFVATANAVVYLNGEPRFADVRPDVGEAGLAAQVDHGIGRGDE